MSKQSSERIDEVVCLYKFTGVYHDYVYFNVKNITSNETVTAVIRTPWIINYEQKLINYLENVNNRNNQEVSISIAMWDSKMESEYKCSWTHKANYKEWGVHKGSVFVLSTPVNNILAKAAVSFAITSLDENYPWLEMLLTVFGCVLAFVLYVFIHIRCRGERRGADNSFYNSA